jgi:hypothetical protein
MSKEQTVEPCGCVKTVSPGYTHTKLCDEHRREIFSPGRVKPNNLDLVGG